MERDNKYPFAEIEAKWRSSSAEEESVEPPPSDGKERRKQYLFTWPASGGSAGGPEVDARLWRRLILADTYGRFLRHRGQDIVLPLGMDGYTPEVRAEARRRETTPSAIVDSDRESLERCASMLGLDTAYSTAATSDPSYYRITQWIFLQLMARGLVYRSERAVDTCRQCGAVHRHGVASSCARCQGELETRKISERRVDVSSYGDRLLGDLDGSERRGGGHGRHRGGWSRYERVAQRERIGRCRGCEVVFPVTRPFELQYHDLEVFTTRVETLYGAMFILIDPYHPALDLVLDPACEEDVLRYRERLKKGGEPRISAVRTGGIAINPLTLKKIPVLASVLADVPYSQGVVMGLPAHDADLFELAKRLRLPVREVIHNDKAKFDHKLRLEQPWLGDGVLTNSGPYSGLQRKVARERIVSALSRKGCCRKCTRFRFSSLPVSHATAWGPAVPLVHCEKCGELPVAESELPLEPARVSSRRNRGGPGKDRIRTKAVCPGCGGQATRDPESLLPWLGTAWSYARQVLPHLAEKLEGFRDLSAPPGLEEPTAKGGAAPAAAGESEPDARGPAEEEGAPESPGASRSEQDPESTPDSGGQLDSPGKQGASEELFPEDVDIFSVPTRPDDEEADAEEGTEPGPEGDSGDPAAPESGQAEEPAVPGPEGPEAEEPAEKQPVEPPAEEAPAAEKPPPEGARPEEDKKGRKEGLRVTGKMEVAAGKNGEPAEEDERSVRERLLQVSSLKPFSSESLKLIPAAVGFGDGSATTQDVLALRFLAKFLHDIGQVPSHMPFFRYVRVEPLFLRKDTESPLPDKTGAPPPSKDGPPGGVEARFDWVRRAETMGTDAVRLHVLFTGPVGRHSVLDPDGIRRMQRLLDRVWRQMKLRRERGKFVSRRMLVKKHHLIYDVTRRLAEWKYHTAVAALMQFLRFLEDPETAPEDMDRGAMATFIILLSPFAPSLAQELWSLMGQTEDLERAPWPVASDELIHPPEREIIIMVDGKVRDRMVQPSDLEPEKLESRALQQDRIRELTGTRKVQKVVVVPQKLVSIALAPQSAQPS